MPKWFVAIAVLLLAVIAPPSRATDKHEKYKPPDLPKEQLADLAFDTQSNVHVKAIDGLAVSSSVNFLSGQAKDWHVYVAPGFHLLVVQLRESWSSGGYARSIRTEASTLLVDLKKGHRYVLVPWYFLNGVEMRFDSSAEGTRTEVSKLFTPDNADKFPWLQNVHFEIYDATDLPDRKWGREVMPDLRWITYADWKWNSRELKTSIPDTFADLDKQIAAQPQEVEAHRQRGLAEVWKPHADYDKALAEATKVIELNPSWARAYYDRAWIWSIKGNVDRELDDLNKAIELAPEFTLALLWRGSAWWAKGNADKAVADYSHAIETDACNIWSYHYRGNLWMQKGEYDRALADQNRALTISPKFAPAYFARAGILSKKQDYDKAIADYTAALAIDPKYFLAYMGRAEALIAKKDYDKALADYSWALKIDDRNTTAYGWRGAICAQKGDYDRAITDYSKALELDPNLINLYNRRGAVWLVKGDIDRAISDFAEALRRAPTDPWASEALAGSYEKKGNYVQAADYCMKAGEIRTANNDLKNAINDWSAAIKGDPLRAAAFQQRAETFAQLGQFDMAIADYTQALALAPEQTQWAQRLTELKTKPYPRTPNQTSTGAPAPTPALASTPAPQTTPARQKLIIQGTLLHYPDRRPVAGVQVLLGFFRGKDFFEPVGAPIAESDSKGFFRLEFDDAVRRVLEPNGKMFSLLAYKDGHSIGTIAQLVKPRHGTDKWDLPREPGILDLDKGGDLFVGPK